MAYRRICVANQKGGVGKTTTTVNLAMGLSEKGKRVLVIDLDPQAHSTGSLGIERDQFEVDIKDVLINGGIERAILTSEYGPHVIPASIRLDRVEQLMATELFREQKLARQLQDLNGAYDFVLMDCRPTLGTLTVNAIFAADLLLIPCEMSRYALEGFADLLDSVDQIKGTGFPMRVLPSKVDSRCKVTNTWVIEQLSSMEHLLLKSWIRSNEALNQAAIARRPILKWAPKSMGARDFEALTTEFMEVCE